MQNRVGGAGVHSRNYHMLSKDRSKIRPNSALHVFSFFKASDLKALG